MIPYWLQITDRLVPFSIDFLFFYLYRKSWYVSIVQIIGPVLDVAFPPGKMPKLYNALVVEGWVYQFLCVVIYWHYQETIEFQLQLGRICLYIVVLRAGMKVFDKGAPFYTEGPREYLRSRYTSLISVYGAFCKPLVGVESSIVSIITLQQPYSFLNDNNPSQSKTSTFFY